jgi:2-polyprenyl-3-methyl-5-hydroxy-6-metoxy-1,4-benzoquinol methylase
MGYLSRAQQENIRVYKEYYSRFAREYEERTREEAKIIAESMAKWISLDNLKILDFGVGTGSVWEQLNLKGINGLSVVGLDIAPGMLKIAKEKGIPWLEVLQRQAEDSDYTNCFDLVCAHGLLRHCAEPSVAVRMAHKALIDNGQFFVEDLSLEDDALKIIRKLTPQIREYLKPSKRESSFFLADDQLVRLIENVGFQRRRYERFVYALPFESFENIRDFLVNKMMFGLDTYKTIPSKHRRQCGEIFLQTVKEELEKPILQRRTFISLFKKKT